MEKIMFKTTLDDDEPPSSEEEIEGEGSEEELPEEDHETDKSHNNAEQNLERLVKRYLEVIDKPEAIGKLIQENANVFNEGKKGRFTKLLNLAIAKDKPETLAFLLKYPLFQDVVKESYAEAKQYALLLGKQNLVALIQKQFSLQEKPVSTASSKGFITPSLEDSSKLESSELVPISTLGNGDCAFHAVFGAWDPQRRQFICQELEKVRKKVANRIKIVTSHDGIYPAIKEAIQQIIMSERRGGGEIKNMRAQYQAYLRENQSIINLAWEAFEQALSKPEYLVVRDYIEKQIPPEKKLSLNTLKLKFDTVLNEDDETLRGMILSFEGLETKFRVYNDKSKENFDWNQYLTQGVIEEYAALIGSPGYWLLPGELELISQILGISIELHIKDGKTKTIRKVEVYNPNANDSVAIYFNGVNHYERMINKKEADLLKNKVESSANQTMATPKAPESSLKKVKSEEIKVPYKFTHKSNAQTVHVAGDFNQWLKAENGIITEEHPEWLMKKGESGVWQLTINLAPGTYQFKYVINNGKGCEWEKDEKCQVSNDKDQNSILTIKENPNPRINYNDTKLTTPEPLPLKTSPNNYQHLQEIGALVTIEQSKFKEDLTVESIDETGKQSKVQLSQSTVSGNTKIENKNRGTPRLLNENESTRSMIETNISHSTFHGNVKMNIQLGKDELKQFNAKLEKIRQEVLNNPGLQEELSLYVPATGAYRLYDAYKFDLKQKIEQFIKGDQKVLLLLGMAGSGKSTFSRYLERELWREYKDGGSIPLFISLPSLEAPTHNLVRDHLKQYFFTEHELDFLQQRPLVLFLDGYDERRQWSNLYTSNQFERWNVKIIFTCRTEYAYQRDNYANFFMPFQNSKPQTSSYVEMTVVPFSPEQIKSYIQKYLELELGKKSKPIKEVIEESERFPLSDEPIWWKEETYHEYFGLVDSIKTIPNLLPILENPFNLNLAMKVMPEIVEQYGKETDILKREHMTRAALYDIFMSEWFIREENKLIATGTNPTDIDDIKPYYWEFCTTLAVEMEKKDVTQVSYIPSQPGIFGPKVPSSSPWEKFFGKHAPNDIMTLVQRAVPVRNSGSQYAFIHPSLLDYFYIRTIVKEESEETKKPEAKYYRLTEDIVETNSNLKNENSMVVEIKEVAQDLSKKLISNLNQDQEEIKADSFYLSSLKTEFLSNTEDHSNTLIFSSINKKNISKLKNKQEDSEAVIAVSLETHQQERGPFKNDKEREMVLEKFREERKREIESNNQSKK